MGWIKAASLLLNGPTDLAMGMWVRNRMADEAEAQHDQMLAGPLTSGTPLVAADA